MMWLWSGSATGLGARFPRFSAATRRRWPARLVASPSSIAAVSSILAMVGLLAWPSSVYLWRMSRFPVYPLRPEDVALIVAWFTAAIALSIATLLYGMRTGVKALEEIG